MQSTVSYRTIGYTVDLVIFAHSPVTVNSYGCSNRATLILVVEATMRIKRYRSFLARTLYRLEGTGRG